MKYFKQLLLVVLLNFITRYLYTYSLKGNIFRSDNRYPIGNAYIILTKNTNVLLQTVSSEYGKFEIPNLDKGEYIIEVKAIGYYKVKKVININNDYFINIFLTPLLVEELEEIVIKSEKKSVSESKNIIEKEIREKLTVSVLGDPITILEKLPGVENISPFTGRFERYLYSSSRFSVRGGSGNENMALLDDTYIPYPYHRLIPDSVFIDDIVGDIVLYKGVLPASYGQTISSLLYLKINDGVPEFHGKANLGLLNTFITLNGASFDNSLKWIFGIRRTNYDLLIPILLLFSSAPEGTEVQIPHYWDAQGKLTYSTKNDDFNFIFHFSSEPTLVSNARDTNNMDSMRNQYKIMIDLNYINSVFHLKWKHKFTKDLILNQDLDFILSKYFSYMYFLTITNTIKTNIEIKEDRLTPVFRYKINSEYQYNKNLEFNFGNEIFYYPNLLFTNMMNRLILVTNSIITNDYYIPGSKTNINYSNNTTNYLIYNTNEVMTNITQEGYNEFYFINSIFLESKIDILNGLFNIFPGLRINYISFNNQLNLDPRLNITYYLYEKNKIYFSIGFLSQFTTDPLILNNLKDYKSNILIPGAWHYIIGSQWNLFKNYSLNIELYLKNYDNIISRNNYTNQYGKREYVCNLYDRNIYGVDLLLSKKLDNIPFYGWISFSSYRIFDYRYTNTTPIDLNVNSLSLSPLNSWFMSYSMDYKLNLMLIYQIIKDLSITFDFNLRSGDYYTPITNYNVVFNNLTFTTNYKPLYGEYLSKKYPDNHYLNIKLEYNGELFNYPYGVYIQAYNVYNLNISNNIINIDTGQVSRYYYPEGSLNLEEEKNFLGTFYFVLGMWVKW